jgi:hypothetical protein
VGSRLSHSQIAYPTPTSVVRRTARPAERALTGE